MATRTAQPPTSLQSPPTRFRPPVDTLLFAVTMSLVVFGFWMVFGTSFFQGMRLSKMSGDPFSFVRKQSVGLVLGLVALWSGMRFGYWKYQKWAKVFLYASGAALVLLWPFHFGPSTLGAHRWIDLKIVQFQPSEVAKVALVIYLAAHFSRSGARPRSYRLGFLPALYPFAAYFVLIEREPDLGTALVLAASALMVMAAAGVRKRHLGLLMGVGLFLVLAVSVFSGHRGSRLTTYMDPCANRDVGGDQVCNSLYGVASGGLLGEGIGRGKQKYLLTQANSDFIFATIAEELGFFRTLPLLVGLAVVGWRGFRIAMATKDRFGALLATGLAALISWQALLNVAVAIGAVPATGVPLPFISYGSSALVVMMGCVGILLNIAQYPEGKPAAPAR